MTQVATKPSAPYATDFLRFEKGASAVGPEWLWRMRREHLGAFTTLGLPGPKDEDWLYTNTAPLREKGFPVAPPPEKAPDSLAAHRFALGLDTGPRLVFLNGYYEPSLSSTSGLPEGATVMNLGSAYYEDAIDVQRHLGRVAHASVHPFASLNTAFIQDGAYIEIPPGCEVEEPIQMLFLHDPTGQAVAVHPRILVVAGPNSKVTVVEAYGIDCIGALAGGTCLTNSVAEFVVGRGASVRAIRIQRDGSRTYHLGFTAVKQEQDSRFASTAVTLGGALDRHEVRVELEEEGAECDLRGLYVIGNDEHADNYTVVQHRVPNCSSRQLFKGILGGRATGAFTGRVVVNPHAQQTNATQANHNLLLSDDATAETRPQLEIYADDVKCAHGATIGQLDADALYYLRSRGLGPLAARNLLVHAFAGEITRGLSDERIADGLDAILGSRLMADPDERIER